MLDQMMVEVKDMATNFELKGLGETILRIDEVSVELEYLDEAPHVVIDNEVILAMADHIRERLKEG